jgi:lipopolysaccharide biosynthesis protein
MGSSRRVCLFAHFDPRHRIRRHVLDYLTALGTLGFEVVLACSGDAAPPVVDREALHGTASLFLRANRGLDFGAWRDLIREGYADGAETILLANDSVFGPFADLSPIITQMCTRQLDVWGMVESLQSGWHLQSWFLHFTAAAFTAPAIRTVFDQPFEDMTKEEVIHRGELALGAAMRKEGLRCDAVVRYADAAWMARIHPTNPMHMDWRHLLVSRRLPFIKGELLRDNAMKIPWITQWADVLRQHYGVSVEGISEYLFAYTGMEPAWPDQVFPTPVARPPLRDLLAYALMSRDHGTALRALAANLTSTIWAGITPLRHQHRAGNAATHHAPFRR